ncbi:EAL domain-containing protein [Vibrio atypicus]|uniref:EAL domain-containing protein n=1 Tax=Vibrio atypicus TaxID=558271 RepID=UPI00135AF3E4|nr:EAL domain-containing protein [Vibrio atypicus]
MKQPISNIRKWLNTVGHHFPVLIPIGGIFACVFLLAAAFNHHQLRQHVLSDGKNSIKELEIYIDDVAGKLQILQQSVGEDCSQQDKLELRSKVFNSRMIKEIGLYKDGVVYCTSNEGRTSIRLFNSTLQRIEASPKHITISLMKSKSKFKTFFIYSSRDKHTGINALLHPQQFLELVSPQFEEQKFGYQIQVLNEVIQSNHNQDLQKKNLYSFSSHLYPFTITIFLTSESYQYHYLKHIGETISIALVLSLIYLILRYQTLAKRSIEHSLVNAIRQEQIELFLQPIVDINTRKVVGSEALVRWNHPTQGQISPEQFIPLAEKLGVINLITRYALKEVTRFLKHNPEYSKSSYISINVSRYQIVEPEFVLYLENYAKRYPHFVNSILLELTENVDLSAEQLDTALLHLNMIQSLGFDIAMDDFGTGYSGLNLIRLINFDVVKIDQVFIKSLHPETDITPVLKSMIQLATELNMKIIAEGVETEHQIEILKMLGVKYIQGFYYARPIQPKELVEFYNMTHSALLASKPIPRWESE